MGIKETPESDVGDIEIRQYDATHPIPPGIAGQVVRNIIKLFDGDTHVEVDQLPLLRIDTDGDLLNHLLQDSQTDGLVRTMLAAVEKTESGRERVVGTLSCREMTPGTGSHPRAYGHISRFLENLSDQVGAMELSCLRVAKDRRGLGMGTSLVENATRIAVDNMLLERYWGSKSGVNLWLNTAPLDQGGDRSVKFFEGLGFERVGDTEYRPQGRAEAFTLAVMTRRPPLPRLDKILF